MNIRKCIYCNITPIVIPDENKYVMPKCALVCKRCGLSSRFHYIMNETVNEWNKYMEKYYHEEHRI